MSEKLPPEQIELHHQKREFMRDKEPGEWFVLPGGDEEGQRIPDSDLMTGCWIARKLNEKKT